jgi:hypothetical protein
MGLAERGWEGVELCWRPYSAGALCILPDSEPTKLPYHPKQKPKREGGLRQINTCFKVPLQVNFLDNDIGIAFYQSNLSTSYSISYIRF